MSQGAISRAMLTTTLNPASCGLIVDPVEANGRISHVFYQKVSMTPTFPSERWSLARACVSSTAPSPLDHRPFGHPAEVNGKISHVIYEWVSNDADVPF